MDLSKFGTLEERIKEIVEEHQVLKKRAQDLEGILRQKENELKQANEKIRELDEEREAIRTKVDSLLELLKNIKINQ
ncbi:MAG TPA: hypothetical protein PLT64_06660 [Syntrophales bacterium]|nr:hypothetical protein [Syntrophales bacterium]HOL59538.1 hypothetical protein [Syntrophales bacterium]HPO35628.1 hypothetical protein [Syntrophales bacterium]